jgi:adenylyl-sulfate kinase
VKTSSDPATAAARRRLSPLERLEALCDPGTLELISAPSGGGGVQAASGRSGGRPIVCYAQDSRVSGGAVGVAEADAIVGALRRGAHVGAPVVGFLESAGARLQEGVAALGGFGRIFSANVALCSRVPQISVITGTAAGGGCYSPALTDFVVMSEGSRMFLTGPRIVQHALGEEVTASALGGSTVHQRNGVCHMVAGSDLEAVGLTQDLLSHLPQTVGEPAPDASPVAPLLSEDPSVVLPPSPRAVYDVRELLRRLVDAGRVLELWERWACNMVVVLARIEGRAVGIIANQPRYLGGIIDVDASQKGARFVALCDRLGLPLLVVVDTPGFMPGTRQESAGVIRHGAELLRAFAGASVPRVTVVVRKAYGGAFITMNCKDLGARASFAWPDAEIGVMSARAMVEILHRRELAESETAEQQAELLALRYVDDHLSAEAALSRRAIDAVIAPTETRARVAEALFERGDVASNGSNGRAAARNGSNGRARPTAPAPDGGTIWLTGLSGAGKSTVATLVASELRTRGRRVEVLDGDVVRQNLSQGLGFSREDRDINIRRIAYVADALSRHGVWVITAAISPYRAARDEARALMGSRFVEIYARASLDTCVRRDTKGLYARALRGELGQFTGVSDPYEEPLAPELVLDTDRERPEDSAAKVLALIERRAAATPAIR